MTTSTLTMLEAVDVVIGRIRILHPEVPELMVVLGASGKTRGGQKHGHFAPKSWKSTNPDSDNLTSELLLSGESLQRGAIDTLGTILHECAHAYCHAQDINDTSNNGRYHNKRFKEIAEDFGLSISKAATIGWSVTTVPEYTVISYANEIEVLNQAITQYRVPNGLKITKPQKKHLMQCPECQDAIAVTKKWFDRNSNLLYCSDHGTPFEMFTEES